MCLVLEEFVRLLHACGMSLNELDICNGRGATVNEIMAQGEQGCRAAVPPALLRLLLPQVWWRPCKCAAPGARPACRRRAALAHCPAVVPPPGALPLLCAGHPRNTLFTGSKAVAEKLAQQFHGRASELGV